MHKTNLIKNMNIKYKNYSYNTYDIITFYYNEMIKKLYK